MSIISEVSILGLSGTIIRQIKVEFLFITVGGTVFDYGIATKGPLQMNGSVEVDGRNEAIEASVYFESENQNLALEMIGKSSIAGDVSIVNPIATVDVSNPSSVGGASGDDAMEHIHTGVEPSDFPTPYPGHFEHYVDTVFDSNDPTSNTTFTNIKIPAHTNPTFSGNININGLMFIETPNVVKFTGNAVITGLIVCNGDIENPSETDLVEFTGTVNSYGVQNLPEEGFSDLKQETGTFLLAPGFNVTFGGDFETINGVIAANGVEFSGNAGGTINGSVINYSEDAMILQGNTDLIFNRSGIEENPSGFQSNKLLQFLPSSYSEPPIY